MDFCHDDFWSPNVTWLAEVPDFTACFQDTALVLLPSAAFCAAAAARLCRGYPGRPGAALPWTSLNVAKVTITICLIALGSSEFGVHLYRRISSGGADSAVFAACARTLSYAVVLALVLLQKRGGVRSSSLLSVFWLCFSFCGTVIYRSSFLRFFKQAGPPLTTDLFVLAMLHYPLIYAEFFLSCFSDARAYDSLEKGSPMDEEPLFSFISFVWFTDVIYKSTKKHLAVSDFPPLCWRQKANNVWGIFQAHWKFLSMSPEGAVSAALQLRSRSLAWALARAFWPWILATCLTDLVFVFARLTNPLMLGLIIDFISSDDPPWKGHLYSVGIIASDFTITMLYNNFLFWTNGFSGQVTSALVSAVYRKSLRLSSRSRGLQGSGTLTNLISVDVERVARFSLYFTALFGAPLKILLTLLLLWRYLGAASLAGAAVIVLLIPITLCVANVGEKLFAKQMSMKDIRVKYMNEILNGIKVLKLYAWEVPFMAKIAATRGREVRFVLSSQMCYVVMSLVFSCAPIMVAVVSFATYLLSDSSHVMDAAIAFVSVNLMNQLRYAIFEVPDAISELLQTNISLGRLRKFFYSEEYDFEAVGNKPDEGEAVSVRAASFSWGGPDSELREVELHVKRGELVAVIGPVGSGKSSLLAALLGEMGLKWGSLDLQGSVAYVPQQPWILNRSVRENVLLVKAMEESRYAELLDKCCLRPDLDAFPAGDDTQIGEKGVNLSGGQKQRLSLARAAFQDADLYLLDDPLSAVDAHVRKELFEHVIGNAGLLRRKTRILVTHDLSVLSGVDTVVCMRDGRVREVGPYAALLARRGPFAAFVEDHLGKQDVSPDEANSDRRLSRLQSKESQHSGDGSVPGKQIQFEDSGETTQTAGLVEEEKMHVGKVSRSVYLNYVKHAGVLLFVPAVLGYMSSEAFEIAGNVWLSRWSEDAALGNATHVSRTTRIAVYGLLGSGQVASFVAGITCLVLAATRASVLYHGEMLHSVMRSPMAFFDRTPCGRIMNRFGPDMDVVDVHLVYELDGWLQCLFACLGVFIVIGMNLPVFLAALLPVIAVYYLVQKVYLNTSRQIKRLESTTRSPIYSHLMESLQGVSSIKAYQVELPFIEKLEGYVDAHIKCFFYGNVCDRWLSFWLSLLGNVVIIAATLMAIENRGVLSAAVVGLTITYALSVTECLTMLVRCNTELENKSVSVERLEEYCNLPSEAPWVDPDQDPPADWPSGGSICFEGFSAKYRDDLDLVLKQLDLDVYSGEKVGIVGRTGAGKSSVTLALFRIIEASEGRVAIDRVDVSRIGLHALRSKLTIIPQDPVLFTGSVRQNVDPSAEHGDDVVWASLEHAHLKSFVSGLPGGLDYELAEGGENLSVGQKQLLCLSRALLKRSKILVLDEATAAVDMDTDRLIQETLREHFAAHTVLTVAHRLHTVLDYDKVVVMEAGEIVEVGNPRHLLQVPLSRFHQMAKDAGLV